MTHFPSAPKCGCRRLVLDAAEERLVCGACGQFYGYLPRDGPARATTRAAVERCLAEHGYYHPSLLHRPSASPEPLFQEPPDDE